MPLFEVGQIWPLELLFFSLTLWLGAYLLKRNFGNIGMRFIGIASLLYACAQDFSLLGTVPSPFQPYLISIHQWFLLTPALMVTGTLLYALPENQRLHNFLVIGWYFSLCPLFLLSSVLSIIFLQPDQLYMLIILLFIPLLIILVLIWKTLWVTNKVVPMLCLMLFAVTVISLTLFPYTYAHILIGGVLLVLGLKIAALDAADLGEAFLPDVFRSFDYAFLTAIVFGGQVALIMFFTSPTLPLLLLLQSTIATAILVQVFSSTVIKLLDGIAFVTFPQVQQKRAKLQATIDVLPRIEEESKATEMDEVEFIRHTRRALSQMGNLPRLASSPLIQIPIIKTRLHHKNLNEHDILEQAAELKLLLTESIHKLKPSNKGDFDTSDEWRYYNSLYFPYVMGIKPYSSRARHTTDTTAQKALDWFRTQIPERTLHNWQKTAAELVAQDIRLKESSGQEKARSGY